MVLKDVDDKSELIKKLKSLLLHPKIYPYKKKQIKFEIYKIEKGWKNEKESAYYINSYFKDSKKAVILHDLRLKVGSTTVQIDHLYIHRAFIAVFESKYFSSDLYYDSKNKVFNLKTKKGFIGIQDPIKQAERQVINLKRIINELNLSKYAPKNYDYFVLVSPNVFFKKEMPEKIIKVDRIKEKLDERADNIGLIDGLISFKDFMKNDLKSLNYLGYKLMQYHKPLEFKDYLNILGLSWLIKNIR